MGRIRCNRCGQDISCHMCEGDGHTFNMVPRPVSLSGTIRDSYNRGPDLYRREPCLSCFGRGERSNHTCSRSPNSYGYY